MKVLAIGNSFSQDTTRYLHDIAKANGDPLEVASLYIGGCPFDKHFRNMKADAKDYELIYNGHNTGFYVSIKEALLSREWDVITLQQQSLKSADVTTFSPYIEYIAGAVREFCPKSLIYLHETWGYENSSAKLSATDFESHSHMYAAIKKSYEKASEIIGADGIIRVGALIDLLHSRHETKVHRDGFHLNFGIGRYAAGLLWYKALLGKMPEVLPKECLDAPISEQQCKLALDIIEGIDSRVACD